MVLGEARAGCGKDFSKRNSEETFQAFLLPNGVSVNVLGCSQRRELSVRVQELFRFGAGGGCTSWTTGTADAPAERHTEGYWFTQMCEALNPWWLSLTHSSQI